MKRPSILSGPRARRIQKAVLAVIAASPPLPPPDEAIAPCGQCGGPRTGGNDRDGYTTLDCATCQTTQRVPRRDGASVPPTRRALGGLQSAAPDSPHSQATAEVLAVLPTSRAARISSATISRTLGRAGGYADWYLRRLMARGLVLRARGDNPDYGQHGGAPSEVWLYWRAT